MNALTFLKNLQLTLTQWLMLSMAVVIGVLVVVLRLQGSRLHKAQVDLLRAHYGTQVGKQDEVTAASKKRFDKALGAYKETL